LRRRLYSPPHVPSRPLAVLRRRLLRCRAARTLTAIDTACFLSISQGPLLRVSAASLRAAGCPTPTRSLPFLELLLRDGRRSSPLRRRRWSRRRRRRSKTRRPQTTDLAALAPTPRCAVVRDGGIRNLWSRRVGHASFSYDGAHLGVSPSAMASMGRNPRKPAERPRRDAFE